ncbi:dienelactone hydrolase family protein [Patescibacteria group bacterium]|nr:dienelactone hydrolase family protein [Patescibacteria group bacterium]MBU1672923.1 dienelactone hydrolase family protein [Patescibacteria group bacterium]MBU1963394.1 dienelactone hydrolase family protein [Patescibacteria group bacterium]
MEENIIHIPVEGHELEGDLKIPENAKGLIIFAHGSGSSRKSIRNNYVADVIRKAGHATLLFDLLTEEEDMIYENRFDIPLLAQRLSTATDYIKRHEETEKLNFGYFGASTGAAAAIIAAAERDDIKAVVSRGGRPDMAGEHLDKINCPTLLIVGGNDEIVIELNDKAFSLMHCEKELIIIPGATHLFEEEGTLEEAAKLAANWFKKYML